MSKLSKSILVAVAYILLWQTPTYAAKKSVQKSAKYQVRANSKKSVKAPQVASDLREPFMEESNSYSANDDRTELEKMIESELDSANSSVH